MRIKRKLLSSLPGRILPLKELTTLLEGAVTGPDAGGCAFTDEDYGENIDMIHSLDEIDDPDSDDDGELVFEVFFGSPDGGTVNRDPDALVKVNEVHYYDSSRKEIVEAVCA